jgi:hypothetical protein
MLCKIAFSLGLLMPLAGMAQVRVNDLVFPAGTKHADDYHVPVVSGVAPEVAAKINLYIQYSLLDLVPGHYRQPLISDDEASSGTTALSYTVTRADSQVLTIDVFGEYMGAHPSTGQTWMSFDVHDGYVIEVADVLTPTGVAQAQSETNKVLIGQIKKAVAHPDPIRLAPGSEDDLKTQRDFYAKCRSDIPTNNWNTTFRIESTLVVSRGCAFPHMVQALDDVGDVEWKASYASLDRYLTTYGRCLLLDRGDDCRRTTVTPTRGVWHGSIGKAAAITFVGAETGPVYFYDRIGTAIPLVTVKAESAHWVLARMDGEGKPQETFDLAPSEGGGFSGIWKQRGKAGIAVVLR